MRINGAGKVNAHAEICGFLCCISNRIVREEEGEQISFFFVHLVWDQFINCGECEIKMRFGPKGALTLLRVG